MSRLPAMLGPMCSSSLLSKPCRVVASPRLPGEH